MGKLFIFLSPAERCVVYKNRSFIESRFGVYLASNTPDEKKSMDSGNATIMVEMDGPDDAVQEAVDYITKFTSSEYIQIFSYPEKLNNIFENVSWIEILEKGHSVTILKHTENKLSIGGSKLCVQSAISALTKLLNALEVEDEQDETMDVSNCIQNIKDTVPDSVKSTVENISQMLPQLQWILLSWIQKAFSKSDKDDSVQILDSESDIEVCEPDDIDSSIVIIEPPTKKEVEVVTLSDEETEDQVESNVNLSSSERNEYSLPFFIVEERVINRRDNNNDLPLFIVSATTTANGLKSSSNTNITANQSSYNNANKTAKRVMNPSSDNNNNNENIAVPSTSNCNNGEAANCKRSSRTRKKNKRKKRLKKSLHNNDCDVNHRFERPNRNRDCNEIRGLKQSSNHVVPTAESRNKVTEPLPEYIPLAKRKCTTATTQNGDSDVIMLPYEPTAPRVLRPIVIDGSNVAIAHGKPKKVFSGKGILLSIEFFQKRGHESVTAFVPHYRRRTMRTDTTDQGILEKLADKQLVVFTPSRQINGKSVSCYDDRFIVQLAHQNGSVILSNDRYRDLMAENDDWKTLIQERLLMFCFVGDILMVPDDPLGKGGPRLDEFLSFPPTPPPSSSRTPSPS